MPIRRCSGVPTRNRPPNDQNAWPPRFDSGSWSSRSTRRPALASSAVAVSPASPAPITIASASIVSSNQVSVYPLGQPLGYHRLMPDPGFDASRPHIAQLPAVQVGVRAQRDLLGRVVRFLVGEAGIRQLLDIGSGLPTAENVHEIAHRIDPATRVVYLDNAPVVLSHAEALLADNQVTFAVEGDLRDPAAILGDPTIRKQLDWDQP